MNLKDCCQDRYKKMCVTLNCQDGSKLDEKCTTGSLGEPYLALDKKNIIVPFGSVDNVVSIKVSFNDNQAGQIRTFIVKGNTSKGLKLLRLIEFVSR